MSDYHGEFDDIAWRAGMTGQEVHDKLHALMAAGDGEGLTRLSKKLGVLPPGIRRLHVKREDSPRYKVVEKKTYDATSPDDSAKIQSIRLSSPSLDLLIRLQQEEIQLDQLHWREFEQLIATMLEEDGYTVDLRGGTKDGGVDILAKRMLPGVGPILTVWQAKHLRQQKVGLNVVRELADVTHEHKASKGVIVTSSFLTKGALNRVNRDQYILGKIDRDDFFEWIWKIKPRRAKTSDRRKTTRAKKRKRHKK